MIYLAIILMIISGISKGARDTIKHHWPKSIFDNDQSYLYWVPYTIYVALFNPKEYGDWRACEKFARKCMVWMKSEKGSKTKKNPLLFMVHDGWHFFDELHIVSTFLGAALIIDQPWYMFLCLFILLALSFNLSYHGFWLKKEFRTWLWFK